MDGKRQYLAVSTAAEATQTRNTRMRRSSRKGDDFIEVGTHYETIGRHEEQHHTCFRNWANSTAASSPEKGWTSKQILREVNRYHNMQAAHVCFLVCRILTYLCFVLLSTACPTSLASDQTKGGGRPGVQRTPRFGAREQRFDLTKIQLSSKLSQKDPKEFAKKFRDATGEPREKRLLQITNLKGKSSETPSSLHIPHREA